MFQSITLPARQVASCVPADLPLDARERMREESWPKMAFIEHSIAGDSTNWWAPDPACVEALLRSAGFHIRARREHEVYLCETAERPRWPDLDSVRRAAAAKDEFDS
jgi:tRNA (mo5U34)-methyltransferase